MTVHKRFGSEITLARLRNELRAEVAELERRHSNVVTLALRIAEAAQVEDQMDEARLLTPQAVAVINEWLDANERRPAWLAEKVEVSRSHLSLVIGRRRECSPRLATDIARVTGVPVGELLPPAHREPQAVAS